MPDESANEIYHCKLDELGGTSTLDKRYLLRDVAETVEKLMTFLEGINVKGMATLEEITLLRDIVSQILQRVPPASASIKMKPEITIWILTL